MVDSNIQANGMNSGAHDKNSDVTSQLKDIAQDFRAKASDVSNAVKREVRDRTSGLGEAAADLAGTAQERVGDVVKQQREAGADYIGSIAQAVGRAANEFQSTVPQAAGYIRQASEKIDDFAGLVREREFGEIVGEVQAYARRQPTVFFVGAVVLGFAALRFLKSTSMSPDSEAHHDKTNAA